MLGYEIVEMFREQQKIDVDYTARRIEQSFLDHYDHIVDILSEGTSLHKLLQILFGPVVDVKQADVDQLLRYGLIKSTDQGTYVAFSAHFQTYLNLIGREVDLWPIWRQTETALRHLVTTKMLERYGEQWIKRLENAHTSLKAIFEKRREAQRREEMTFGSRASRNLIDFTYPQDLFDIIFTEWNTIFNFIFGKDKNYWKHRADLLAKVRTPLAHNRDEVLHDYERQLAEGYCKEILMVVKSPEG